MRDDVKWLRKSGIAGDVGAVAWAVFMEIVERDCEEHPMMPGDVRASMDAIGKAIGLGANLVQKELKRLIKKRYIRAFVPDNFFEECIIRVAVPLETPVPADQIRQSQINLGEADYRYLKATDDREPGKHGLYTDGHGHTRTGTDVGCEPGGERGVGEGTADPSVFDWLVDRWLGVTAGAVNVLQLDRIRWMAEKFTREQIEQAWEDERKNGKITLWGLERRLIPKEGERVKSERGTQNAGKIRKTNQGRREGRRHNYFGR